MEEPADDGGSTPTAPTMGPLFPVPPPRKRGSQQSSLSGRNSLASIPSEGGSGSPTRSGSEAELPSPVSLPHHDPSNPFRRSGDALPPRAADDPSPDGSPRNGSPKAEAPRVAPSSLQQRLESLRARLKAGLPPPDTDYSGSAPSLSSTWPVYPTPPEAAGFPGPSEAIPGPSTSPAPSAPSISGETSDSDDSDALSYDEGSERSSVADKSFLNDTYATVLPALAEESSSGSLPRPPPRTGTGSGSASRSNSGASLIGREGGGHHLHRHSPGITVNTTLPPGAPGRESAGQQPSSASKSSLPSELSASTDNTSPKTKAPPRELPPLPPLPPSVAAWEHILATEAGAELAGMVPRLAVDPLTSPYPLFVYVPHILDSLSGSLPLDAWDLGEIPDDASAEGATEVGDPLAKLRESRVKRDHVMKEIYETEVSYLGKLQIMDRVFRTQLRRILGEAGEPSIRRIFGGLDELLAIHTEFRARVRQLCLTWNQDSGVGDLFREFKPKLTQGYAVYIDNFQNCRDEMNNLDRTNSEYRQFTKDCLTSPETEKTTLSEFLLYPVQRTTRYTLLLREMVKHTPKDHPDHENCVAAQKEMEEWTTRVNELKRAEEERTAMFQAFSQTENCPASLISSTRRLVFQCDATDGKSSKPLHIYLFSDLIMVAKPIKGGLWFLPTPTAVDGDKLYKFVRWLDLRDVSVSDDTVTKSNRQQVRLLLRYTRGTNSLTTFPGTDEKPATASETVTFAFASDEERDRFVAALQSEMKRGKR